MDKLASKRPVEFVGAAIMTCSKCSECQGSSHHWIDKWDENNPDEVTHTCMHCDALGVKCYRCDGDGSIDEPSYAHEPCWKCNGEGVLQYIHEPILSKHTSGPWRVGSHGSVVANSPIPGVNGSDAVDYYGGHLVCESVTPSNAKLIALAPEMYDLLATIENDGKQVPDWLWKKIQDLLSRAR